MWEIKTLGRADDERARDMLEKTAWQVQPIMRKRGWKVQELCEMKPEQCDRVGDNLNICLLYTSPSPRDQRGSRMPSSA